MGFNCMPQGQSHFKEAVYFLPLSSQKFLVLILPTSKVFKPQWVWTRDPWIGNPVPWLLGHQYAGRGQDIENQARRCTWGHDYPLVEHTVLVPNDGLTSPRFPCNSSTKHPSITIQSRSATSTLFENKWNCWQFIYQQIPQTSKHSTRNYRCYPGVVETNHKFKIWVRTQKMAQLCDIKEWESLFSRCNCCIGIFTWYVS